VVLFRQVTDESMPTSTKARGLRRVHYGLIHGLYGEDTPKAGMAMGEVGHKGGPSERATIVVVRLAFCLDGWSSEIPQAYLRRTGDRLYSLTCGIR
jgi:hypothetical protein